jgi:hypothetical protein
MEAVMIRLRSLYLTAAALSLSACMATPPGTVSETASEREAATPPLVEPVMEPKVFESVPEPAGRYRGTAQRGVITAGDIDDTLNLPAFLRYLARSGGDLGLPQIGFGSPVLARLTGPDGTPAPGARYTLRKPGGAEPFYSGYAGPDGRIAVFPAVLGAGKLSRVELRVPSPDGQGDVQQVLTGGSETTVSLPFDAEWQPDFLDLVLVVDTTGSMGDEIAFLNKELIGITRAAARSAPGVSIRYGLIAYRDQGDDYVVKSYGFTGRAGEMAGWLRQLSADGGGDYPEAAAAALTAGVGLNWRAGKGERLLIQVADAPPHSGDSSSYLRAAKAAAGKGVQIFTLGASGVGPEAEYLMRQASAATGGRYMFLTDDSGVGLSHEEPSISCYRVTKLSRLLTRILASELSGRRKEAGDGEVIRETGTYRSGVCVN